MPIGALLGTEGFMFPFYPGTVLQN
jgi:hypothetical protein